MASKRRRRRGAAVARNLPICKSGYVWCPVPWSPGVACCPIESRSGAGGQVHIKPGEPTWPGYAGRTRDYVAVRRAAGVSPVHRGYAGGCMLYDAAAAVSGSRCC